MLAVLVLIAVLFHLMPRLPGENAVPAELVGSWQTDDSRYVGRTLILSSDAMIFRASITGAGSSYRVRRVQRHQGPGVIEYVIVGDSDAEGENILSLKYRVADKLIELENPDGVLWKRTR